MITNVLGHCYHDDFLSTFKGADYHAFTEQKYIHADETPVQVNKEKEPGNKKQYMWV